MPVKLLASRYSEGEKVVFEPTRGARRNGEVQFDFEHRKGFVFVLLDNDPFPVYVNQTQVIRQGAKVPTKQAEVDEAPVRRKRKVGAKPKATRRVKQEVVEEAAPKPKRGRPPKAASKASKATKRTVAAKAPAAKKVAPKKATATRAPRELMDRPLDNPFRPQSNAYEFTEALKKGGKRSALVRGLLRKITVAPWSQNGDEYEDVEAQCDKRLTMVAKQLENTYGWDIERSGRGSESKIKATPPSSKPRKRAAKPVSETPAAPKKVARTVKKATKRPSTRKRAA